MTYYNRKLDHINLKVPNLEETIKYYTEILGFKVSNRFKKDMEFVFVTDGHVTYEIIENKALEMTIIDHIAYESDDIKADYAYFEKLGLVTSKIGFIDFIFEQGVYYFFIKGFGNEKIEFCQKIKQSSIN